MTKRGRRRTTGFGSHLFPFSSRVVHQDFECRGGLCVCKPPPTTNTCRGDPQDHDQRGRPSVASVGSDVEDNEGGRDETQPVDLDRPVVALEQLLGEVVEPQAIAAGLVDHAVTQARKHRGVGIEREYAARVTAP
jgi:hypothetical protein